MDTFAPYVLGRYSVLKPLGQGGMAEVFLAEHGGAQGFSKLVVIKRIRALHWDNPKVLEMFVDEARLMLSVQHPNVLQVLELQEDPQGIYMVLEYADGSDLFRLVSELRKADRVLPVPIAAYAVGSVLRGLAHAHDAVGPTGGRLNLIHRDVTPSNVLLTSGGQVKLADFGVAKARERSQAQTEVGGVKGKLAYMAPEMLTKGRCDQRSDLFSVGVVLWECLTGRRLFPQDQEYSILNALLHEPIPSPLSVRPDLPPNLVAVVMRALEREPDKRFQTAKELERALYAFVKDHHPDALAEELASLIKKNVTLLSASAVAALPRPKPPRAKTELIHAPLESRAVRLSASMEETQMGAPRPQDPGEATIRNEPPPPSATDFFAPSSSKNSVPDWAHELPPAPAKASAPAVNLDDFFNAPEKPPPQKPCVVKTPQGVEHVDAKDAWAAVLKGTAVAARYKERPLRMAADVRLWTLCPRISDVEPKGVAPVLAGVFPGSIPKDFFKYARDGQINGLMVVMAPTKQKAAIFILRGMVDLVVSDDAVGSIPEALHPKDDAGLEKLLQTILDKGLALPGGMVPDSRLRQVVDSVNLRRIRAMEKLGPCTFQYFTDVMTPLVLPPSMVPFGPQLAGVTIDHTGF